MERARVSVAILSIGAGFAFFVFLSSLVGDPERAGALSDQAAGLLVGNDDLGLEWSFPVSVQLPMWIVFFLGIGEIAVRATQAHREARMLSKGYLDGFTVTDRAGKTREVVIGPDQLGEIFQRLDADKEKYGTLNLPMLLTRCVQVLQSSGRLEHASALLNSTMELLQHEMDMRYSVLRYIVWLVPTLGFIGTVIGISQALTIAGKQVVLQGDTIDLEPVVVQLGVAFYTTLLALLMSALLVLALYIVQAYEEGALNRSGQYCLQGLLNKLAPDLPKPE